ncbi:SacI domain-containing protein [Diaporthe amygdali]|uniref:SacI domain-containing protein n=1 Tax=Phomopsis amygdali TaxID=1214568 RepID=UPI0022FDCE9F|nr:SacI domain-containing protein [Diaporthe amygdali]KAJ0119167.1 SacI domain-containing protein [Diaporthe amygdali]
MPSLARKVIIAAAVDGLLIQPLATKKEHKPSPPVRLRYGDAAISFVSRDGLQDLSKPNSSFEAFGVVGLITVSRFSYLVSIVRRKQVAVIRGSPVYVITEVALTPCSSYNDASESIAKTAVQVGNKGADETTGDDTDTDAGDDTDTDTASIKSDEVPTDDERPDAPDGSKLSATSVAKDVMTRRGSYGRFAQRWFSSSGWTLEQKRSMGLSQSEENVNKAVDKAGDSNLPGDSKSPAATKEDVTSSEAAGVPVEDAKEEKMAPPALLPKLLRTTQILFGSSQSYFFSYDYDITRSLSKQREATPQGDTPLYRKTDPMFFWNQNVIQPFIDAGVDSLALPLMKGFVGQRTFTVDAQPEQLDEYKGSVEMNDFATNWSTSAPESEAANSSTPSGKISITPRSSERQFDITVISRRSVKRAGLRYLRRGIDEEGWCANSVETEQILSPAIIDPKSKVYSFLQIRGSIPVFFTQSPYSLKPSPVFQHSDDSNFQALKKHFDRLHQQYGSLQIANLVEKHGVEAPIGQKYEHGMERYNESSSKEDVVPFEWFDFHDACRGMKFENVQKLIDTLQDQLDTLGSTMEEAGEIKTQQKGVIRTNCMDCLDRTNVCQSSFAKYMLDAQLREQGYDMTTQLDQLNSWFNTLWADNGDAISKQYASTAAMKGDYTRTKKRNYRGALADAGLGLTRFFNGMVNDFFLQATIDFLLGNVTSLVFDEFEANMMTKDPAVSIQKVRDQAIELCQKRVVEDAKEEFIGGWTFLSPAVTNNLMASPLQEVVFLLTDTAIYLCRFDWNLDKVSSFDRVDLSHVQSIKSGTYITSTVSATQTDESKNVGLVIVYEPGSNDYRRVNTRSLSSTKDNGQDAASDNASAPKTTNVSSSSPVQSRLTGLLGRKGGAAPAETKKITLKAPYTNSSLADRGGKANASRMTESQLVAAVAHEIERLAFLNQPVSGTAEAKRQSIIEEGDIVSLVEAKRNVGIFETLGYNLKRLVWA